ncbi:rod shape-determining protein MreD [Candidatus Formimonas warabiya]|uniref:Rod shape-determining protein MreD n=1 Tax=Formimonas warabiya TaxID=1761012 RepID=A0A3G1KSV6_FORW1|nr:rod shape-determining protein MreD [Candidatus Formimonas warabiya]ATW25494.1 rod shape-determining protein MreD [Candidatus Formimonas warabiya]
MKTFVFAVGIILCLLIQKSVFFLNFGTKPDFLLILVIFLSLLKGPVPGLKIGFIIGFVEDLVEGKYFGINILTKMLTGLMIGFMEPKIFKENYLVPVVTVCLGTLLNEILFVFFGNLIGMGFPWGTSFWHRILPLTLYNSIVAVFVYVPFYKLYISKWLNKER